MSIFPKKKRTYNLINADLVDNLNNNNPYIGLYTIINI